MTKQGTKRKTGLMLCILIICLIIFSACDSITLPQVLASDTQETVEEVKVDNDAVFKEIQKNIDMVSDLRATVEEAQLSDRALFLNDVIKDIENVTESYEKLAGQRDNIRRSLLNKINSIEDLQAKVNSEIDDLNERREYYRSQLREIDNTNPDIARTRKKSLTQAIEYVNAQIHLWTEFSKIETGIIIEMYNVQYRIDSFLSVIDSSALLFREGLNLLYLQRDINEALSLFTSDIPRMEQLSRDMETSWDNLDILVDNLTSMSMPLSLSK